MNVKIIKLITAEQIIAIINEVKDDNGADVGFKITFPFLVVTIPLQQNEGDPLKFDVNYVAWMTASADVDFVIPYTSVIAFGEPGTEIKNMYLKRYQEYLDYLTEPEE